MKSFVNMISGAAAPTIFHRDRYVSILRTAGYSYNRNLDTSKKKFYESLFLYHIKKPLSNLNSQRFSLMNSRCFITFVFTILPITPSAKLCIWCKRW